MPTTSKMKRMIKIVLLGCILSRNINGEIAPFKDQMIETIEKNTDKFVPSDLSDMFEDALAGLPSQSPAPSSFPTISLSPTEIPTSVPSITTSPSSAPSTMPTFLPTTLPTTSFSPSISPTMIPSLFPTDSPTSNPSSLPSLTPSTLPTSIPSILPTDSSYPSVTPSSPPTVSPTSAPTTLSPTKNPSIEPTVSFAPTVKRSRSFWSYNPGSKYGPKEWDRTRGLDEVFIEMSGSSSNRCDSSSQQSPIILEENSECVDDHQIHTHRGHFNFETVEFEVLPHALRCSFIDSVIEKDSNSTEPPDRAPRADFSNLSEFVPARIMDVKIPSEHKMVDDKTGDFRSYPGEIQIAHEWGSKIVMIGFFFDYEFDEHNEQFEQFILKWEDIFFEQEHECSKAKGSYQPKFKEKSTKEMIDLWGNRRDWPGSADYDLYRLLPTVYYYGYRGSATAPPCTRNVIWRFLDVPMKISHNQYLRIQRVLLDQSDEDCKSSSKAFHGGVNRPIQKIKDNVYRCTGFHWTVRFPGLWCGKWQKDYHGIKRLKGACPEFNKD